MIKIYHNVRCSKSREACSIIADKGIKAEVVEYLKTPPTQKEIKELLGLLKLKAEEIVRKGEEIYKTKYKGKTFTEALNFLGEAPTVDSATTWTDFAHFRARSTNPTGTITNAYGIRLDSIGIGFAGT